MRKRKKMTKFKGFTDDLETEYHAWAVRQSEYPDPKTLKILKISEVLGCYPDCDSWREFFDMTYYADGDLKGIEELGMRTVDND